MPDLNDITTRLGTAYRKWKDGEKQKDEAKIDFFEAINALAQENPEEQLITVPIYELSESAENDLGEELRHYVEREHPEWDLDEWREVHPDEEDDRDFSPYIEAILTLRPELKDYSFVNPADGMVYRRQFVSGTPMLDEERLQEDDWDVWIAISEIPNYDHIASIVRIILEPVREQNGWETLEHHIQGWIDEHWEGPRTLKPLDQIDGETLSYIQNYIIPGKPSVKLAAPRKAKPEELESA